MKLELTVPSKTFLLGEYIALKGGPALVLSTEPSFTLIATRQPSKTLQADAIHPNSPAGKLLTKYKGFYQDYLIQFIDPYQGLGGFGASTAQFVAIAALKYHVQGAKIDPFALLEEYKTLAWDGKGLAPSGADLISQICGQLCYFNGTKQYIQSFNWPFADLNYGLIHTGNKLATHKHLQELSHLHLEELEKIAYIGLESIERKNKDQFIEAIKQYAYHLKEQDLTAQATQEILKQLTTQTDIIAAKGCGALGADVILILFDTQKTNKVMDWLKQHRFNLIAFGHHLAKGLSIRTHESI